MNTVQTKLIFKFRKQYKYWYFYVQDGAAVVTVVVGCAVVVGSTVDNAVVTSVVCGSVVVIGGAVVSVVVLGVVVVVVVLGTVVVVVVDTVLE